jgi:hypothetical protein
MSPGVRQLGGSTMLSTGFIESRVWFQQVGHVVGDLEVVLAKPEQKCLAYRDLHNEASHLRIRS